MRIIGTIVRELWGLFVDDGALAVALVVWCAVAGFGLPRSGLADPWQGPTLFLGCLVILIVNVWMSARARGLTIDRV